MRVTGVFLDDGAQPPHVKIDRAGFALVSRTPHAGEELVANLFGWGVRSLEMTAEPAEVPARWQSFALRSYLTLQRLDARLLEPRLPAELFYNLVLSAKAPQP